MWRERVWRRLGLRLLWSGRKLVRGCCVHVYARDAFPGSTCKWKRKRRGEERRGGGAERRAVRGKERGGAERRAVAVVIRHLKVLQCVGANWAAAPGVLDVG